MLSDDPRERPLCTYAASLLHIIARIAFLPELSHAIYLFACISTFHTYASVLHTGKGT